MKVVISADARADLKAIARWIGTDNPDRADSFSGELRRACGTLGRYSSRYPVVRTTSGYEVRKRVHDRYLILYRVLEKEVEVLRIVHGSRDWAALLGEAE